jgi:hypothetical protein
MIEYREIPDSDLVEIELDGAIDRPAFDRIAGQLEAAIKRHGKLRLLEVVKSFSGIDPGTLIEDIKFSFRHLNAFSRVAVVTDLAWLKPLATVAGTLAPAEVKVFPLAEIGTARQWLRGEGAVAT